jgi:hypothetical protein
VLELVEANRLKIIPKSSTICSLQAFPDLISQDRFKTELNEEKKQKKKCFFGGAFSHFEEG